MCEFNDKVVIVTGASSGIGRATAVLFAKKGAKVVLVGRNKEKLAITEKECVAAGKKENVFLVSAELTKLDEVKKVVDETVAKFKQIDVLVNNAGAGRTESIATTTPEVFDEMITLNAKSPFFMIQYAVPHLKKTQGSIVNVSSIGGERGQARYTAYAMAKAACDQLTRSVCAEFGPQGIRCNSVNPGVIETDFSAAAGTANEPTRQAFLQAVAKRTPAQRLGKPEDIATVIVFLASKCAAYVHGANLNADGGLVETMG